MTLKLCDAVSVYMIGILLLWSMLRLNYLFLDNLYYCMMRSGLHDTVA